MQKVDITLISGARPLLLEQTLQSFHEKLILDLPVSRIFANIDLFGGDETDRQSSGQVIKKYFPRAEIFQPKEPNFTVAVQRIWKKTTAPLVLHLEDDWILLETIRFSEVLDCFKADTKAVKFLSKEHNITNPESMYDVGYIRRKFLGITWSKTSFNRHGTSPGFFDGEFLRGWAKRMNLDLDPEKQARPDLNSDVFDYVRRFRSRFIFGRTRPEIIRDIGREWRDQNRILKTVVRGRSQWEKQR